MVDAPEPSDAGGRVDELADLRAAHATQPGRPPSERLPSKVTIVPATAPPASKLPPPPPPLPTPAALPPLPSALPSTSPLSAGPSLQVSSESTAEDLARDLDQQRLELARERLELERLKLELAQLQAGVRQPTDKVRNMRPSDRARAPRGGTSRGAGEPAPKGGSPALLIAVGLLGAGAAVGGAIYLTSGGKKQPTQVTDGPIAPPAKVEPPKPEPGKPSPKPAVPFEPNPRPDVRDPKPAPPAERPRPTPRPVEPEAEPVPPDPIPDEPRPDRPRPRPDPTPRTGTKEPTTSGENSELLELFAAALAHYTEKDAVRLGRVLTSMETIAPDAPETHAARGLFAELAGRFNEAASELQKAGGKGGWVTARALIRALFATLRFEAAREVIPRLTEGERDLWTSLIDGPFRKSYPLAADSCVANTPDGRYRVITDLGLPVGHLAKLEKKLQETPEAERAKKVAAAARSHKGLQELCDVMDKAYKAYGKLFQTEEPSQIYPTVYVLQSRADFDRFSASLDYTGMENVLGYYVPSFRILVFYDQPEGRVPGRMLSQGTLNVLLHETFHQWLDLHTDDSPRWFDEGLAEYFGIGEMTSSGLRYGLVPTLHPSRLDNIREALTGALYEPLPLADMIRADRNTFYGARSAVNYAQAWSFVHYLGSSTKGQKTLREYFKALRRGSDLDTAFKEVFGTTDMAAVEKDWREYVGKLR